jgi:hypothetical protein
MKQRRQPTQQQPDGVAERSASPKGRRDLRRRRGGDQLRKRRFYRAHPHEYDDAAFWKHKPMPREN